MWDSANVSGTVTSHASGLPLAQGRRLVQLLFSSIKLTGYFNAGIWARLMALHMMSFMWLWRCCLEAVLRQDNPWSPCASTALPHTEMCGSQALQPSLRATAILMASSESLRLTEVIGGAWSQSSLCKDATTRSLALSTSQRALEKIWTWWFVTTCLFHAFWMCCTSTAGVSELASPIHSASVASTDWSNCAGMLSGRMDCWSCNVDAADVW